MKKEKINKEIYKSLSKEGRAYFKKHGKLPITNVISDRLVGHGAGKFS